MIMRNLPIYIKLVFVSLLVTLISCSDDTSDIIVMDYEEASYRPNFHFTPKSNWMNDPNGMFYYNGTYHLYFQHYPDDNV
jgi:levanase/fructan beta-fructosidase